MFEARYNRQNTMRLAAPYVALILLLGTVGSVVAVPSWGFDDATISVQPKGAGIGGGFKEKYGLLCSMPSTAR